MATDQPARPARLTVQETTYFQFEGTSPVSVPVRFERKYRTVGRPYESDPQIIGSDWVPLDLGGATSAAVIIVTNEEGRKWQLRPTPEQLAEAMARVVEVSFRDPPAADVLVLPTEGQRIHAADPTALRVRCRSGEARIITTVYPG